jgi:hypothetical protein
MTAGDHMLLARIFFVFFLNLFRTASVSVAPVLGPRPTPSALLVFVALHQILMSLSTAAHLFSFGGDDLLLFCYSFHCLFLLVWKRDEALEIMYDARCDNFWKSLKKRGAFVSSFWWVWFCSSPLWTSIPPTYVAALWLVEASAYGHCTIYFLCSCFTKYY